jgi:mono/diheme cytochrome c family protein
MHDDASSIGMAGTSAAMTGWGFATQAVVACLVLAVFTSTALAETAPTPEQIDQGREVYEEFCQTCHGRDMVSSGAVTYDLRKFPKDDGNRFRSSVLKGKGPAMPAFEGRISDEEVTLLWAYVRGGP